MTDLVHTVCISQDTCMLSINKEGKKSLTGSSINRR